MPRSKPIKTDVLIVGGGLIGLTTALALASKNIPCTLIEAHDFKQRKNQKPDGRASAIAHGSHLFLDAISVWQKLAKKAGDILDIRITDGNSPLFLHYEHSLVGDAPMGHMLANNDIWDALHDLAQQHKHITLLDQTRWTKISEEPSHVNVTLSNGNIIRTSLLLAADGKFSAIRKHFNITTHGWDYPQSGIVCNVKHEKHHQHTAQERFLPSGPFAILPLKGGHESSLVWTEKSHLVECYLTMPEAHLTQEINKRFGNYLGAVTLSSKVMSYPLSLVNADSYTTGRMALIGDAAHAIHPIAGQGFNLGIRDIETLLPLLTSQFDIGYDLGNSSILKEYETKRRFDAMSLIAITDVLNRLFSNQQPLLKFARNIGMAAVNKLPKLKKNLMKHAMGMQQK